MAGRTGRGYYAHFVRALTPPDNREVVWYKYDTDEFFYYDYNVPKWVSKDKQFWDSVRKLESEVKILKNEINSGSVTDVGTKYKQTIGFQNAIEICNSEFNANFIIILTVVGYTGQVVNDYEINYSDKGISINFIIPTSAKIFFLIS
jgi:hypothetical protein